MKKALYRFLDKLIDEFFIFLSSIIMVFFSLLTPGYLCYLTFWRFPSMPLWIVRTMMFFSLYVGWRVSVILFEKWVRPSNDMELRREMDVWKDGYIAEVKRAEALEERLTKLLAGDTSEDGLLYLRRMAGYYEDSFNYSANKFCQMDLELLEAKRKVRELEKKVEELEAQLQDD